MNLPAERPSLRQELALAVGGAILQAANLRDPALALAACIDARRLLESDPGYTLLDYVPFEEADHSGLRGHAMRAPCRDCGSRAGTIARRSGQDVVRCARCDRYQYCAPRSETRGRP